ncbi:type VI immunity family protein [Corallococcus sp. bb12-1]|uniref:type VI immunity family protein n=1 Tax=Corallococcus sp. bb12-1 TaxID=2996784 RepID=UPI002D1E4255|nr:type VI immunity family protein [Corallococcus sp. bb12-1]
MSDPFPHIQLRSRSGALAARDGVVLSFFIHRDHKEVAPAIWRALETFLHAIPPKTLNWYVSEEGDMDPLDNKGWEHIRKKMLERIWGLAWIVELSESPSEAGGYQFEYYGKKLDAPVGFYGGDPATAVSFTFPTEYLLEHGPDHLRALAFKLAWELPFSFGYASFAIVAPHGYWGAGDWDLLDSLRERYLGLDLDHVSNTSATIGTHARSASWLTFLGQPLLGQLGGIEGLRGALPFPEVSLLPLDSQRLLISLSEWPEAIDIQQGGIPPQYRALALRLEPFLYQERAGLPPRYEYTWLRRLCR